MLRSAILLASRNETMKRVVSGAPGTRTVVKRFVPGTEVDDALATVSALAEDNLAFSIDYLGEDTTDLEQAESTKNAYLGLLNVLDAAGLAAGADLSVKITAVGQLLDPKIGYENTRAICQAAGALGATVTLDMEDHTMTDMTLEMVHRLRKEFPSVGTVIQAYLLRSEDDCRALTGPGSRVRLCKGAYAEPDSVAHTDKTEIDKAYVRCLRILLEGEGYPMIATHDPRLIPIAQYLVGETGRAVNTYEFQMLYGIRSGEQRRLVSIGEHVRIYVPFGTDWWGYFMRRLAERPANLKFFARALIGGN